MKVIPARVFEQEPTRQTSESRGDITMLIDDKEVPLRSFETWPVLSDYNVDVYGSFEVYSDLSEKERAT